VLHGILIVCELPDIELGDSFLDRRSFTVRNAGTAQEALAIARRWPPSLIVFSRRPAGMSIAELCRAVRAEPVLADTRLVLVSGQVGDAEVAGGPGPDVHLIEPVTEAQLLAAIGKLLGVPERRSPRVSVELLATVAVEGGRSVMANLLTLGQHGMLLECAEPLPRNVPLTVTFFLPGGERLEVHGRVTSIDGVQHHYGVEILGAADAEREAIAAFIAALSPDEGVA